MARFSSAHKFLSSSFAIATPSGLAELQLATDEGTRKVIRDMMQEARLVGEALGVKFSVDVDERIAMAEKVGNHRTSMLQDVEAGRTTELDSLLGVVIELAQMVGIATPTLNLVYDLTKFRSKT